MAMLVLTVAVVFSLIFTLMYVEVTNSASSVRQSKLEGENYIDSATIALPFHEGNIFQHCLY